MKKLLSLLLALVLMASVPFAALADAPTELVVWMMGDKPAGADAVMEKANAILAEKLNVTLNMNFFGWADWATAYELQLTSGQPIDLIYAAEWANSVEFAKMGAFLDLTDLVEEHAPELWEMIPMDAWDFATLDTEAGEIMYCIPTGYVTYPGNGIIYREDLRKQFDLPVPDSLENVTAYMKGIKENCPELTVAMEAGDAIQQLIKLDYFNLMYNEGVGMMIGTTANKEANDADPAKYESYFEKDSEVLRLMAETAKKWTDEGYISKNLSANPVTDVMPYFEQGLIAMTYYGTNVDKWGEQVRKAAENHPDWEIGFVPLGSTFNYAFRSSPIQDATAIPKSAAHPELALAAMQEIYTNKELHQLLAYGIEGEHYELDAEGCYMKGPKGDDFAAFALNTWAWKVNEFLLPSGKTAADEAYAAKIAEMDACVPVLSSKFVFDTTGNEATLAALAQVNEQYLKPLLYGVSEDIEADIAQFIEKSEAAGLREMQAEYIRQYTEFCADNETK